MATAAICRYCNKVELTFDNAFKSKTGKLIPLDKTSGLPHECAENPYSKQQQQQQSQQPQPDLFLEVKLLSQKMDKVISLLTAANTRD